MSEEIKKLEKIEKYLEQLTKNGIPIRNLFTTKSRKETSQAVNTATYEFLNIRGFGTIDQLLIKSNSSSFNVHIFLDDETYLNESYTYLNGNQNYLNNVSAFNIGSTYYVILKNMNFQKSAFIRLITSASVTFSEILSIYNIREERLIVG